MYVVYFDDGRMLGKGTLLAGKWRFVCEFADAHQFSNKRVAEQAARDVSLPSTVEKV